MFSIKKILLVDDDQNVHFIISRILDKHRNYSLVVSSNAPAAIEKIKLEKFDLILMDMCMPDMDGIKAIRLIRSLPVGENIPILLMASSDTIEHRCAALDAGATAYISKPFFRDGLIKEIDKFL